jgi:pilus assembly protein TadC
MESILDRMRLGESAAEALRRASAHPGRELRRFCRTLLRAGETGAPVADILEELAVEFRNGRREREKARASRISIYILFPLVFMILPSFMLLTLGGIILGNAS